MVGASDFLSQEEKIVVEIYRGLLKREPTEEWLRKHAQDLHETGVTGGLSQLIQHFVTSDEFQRNHSDQAEENFHLVNSSRHYLRIENESFAKRVVPGSIVLDVGAGDQPYRYLYDHAKYESADFEQVNKTYAKSTYVCDVTDRIPVDDERFDHIIFNQTMEHLKNPGRALAEINRVLKTGGTVLCTCPLFYDEHEIPHDYYRYTKYAHQHLWSSAGFEVSEIRWMEGFFGTCGYMLECIYRYSGQEIHSTSTDAKIARSFISAFRKTALIAAGTFYRIDMKWKVTSAGFPKNYVVIASKL